MAAMAEQELVNSDACTLEKTQDTAGSGAVESVAQKDTVSDTEYEGKSEDNLEVENDEFGSFGSEVNDSTNDDFGDFNDFDDFEAPSETPAASNIPTATIPPLETLLSLSDAYFQNPVDRCKHQETTLKCMNMAFADTEPNTKSPVILSPKTTLLTNENVRGAVTKLGHASDGPPKVESRLLRNLLVIAASSNLLQSCYSDLLKPLSELGSISSDTALEGHEVLSISEVRRLAACSADELDNETGQKSLQQALSSIELLISEKKQCVAKQRDEVDAYNQVIQTLVAQATKLH